MNRSVTDAALEHPQDECRAGVVARSTLILVLGLMSWFTLVLIILSRY